MEKEAKQEQRRRLIRLICIIVFAASAAGLAGYNTDRFYREQSAKEVQAALRDIRETEDTAMEETDASEAAGIEFLIRCEESEILPKYRALYEINPDMAGWLKIEGTVIDYPVMQTPEDK